MRFLYIYLLVSASALAQYTPPVASDSAVFSNLNQTISGNKTFSGTLAATSTISLKGYVVDSFAASLLTATSSADIRSKLSLGGAALLNVGAASGTVAAGNDSRIVNAVQQSGVATLSAATMGGATVSGVLSVSTLSGAKTVNGTTTFTGPLQSTAGNYPNGIISSGSGDWIGHITFQNLAGTTNSRNWTIAQHSNGALGILTNDDNFTGGGNSNPVVLERVIVAKTTWPPADIDSSNTLEVQTGNIGASNGDVRIAGAGRALKFGSGSVGVYYGSGSPEGVVTAPVGSLYLRSDGGSSTTLYVKQSGTGNTGWTAK